LTAWMPRCCVRVWDSGATNTSTAPQPVKFELWIEHPKLQRCALLCLNMLCGLSADLSKLRFKLRSHGWRTAFVE
jgi:hypothetical protein